MIQDLPLLTEPTLPKSGEIIQLSGADKHNNNFLSVLVKKSYQLLSDGKCVKSDLSIPLHFDFQFKKENEELLNEDTDLYLNKPFTDLVIKGQCYCVGSIKESYVIVEVSNQKTRLDLKICGKRLAYKDQYGEIMFTKPEHLQNIPLEYNFAYGGVDLIAEEKFIHPDQKLLDAIPGFDWKKVSPFRYPRNTCGKGYLVENNAMAFENLELPNIEDPLTPLSPSNLIVGKPENWIYQPLPRSTTWVNPSWFPRIAYFGVLPPFDSSAKLKMLPEYLQKLVEPDILENKLIAEKLNIRASNGASLGLQFPYLNGNESIRLVNIHPKKQDFMLQLPNDRPKIWIDGRNGKLIATVPVIHTIVIEPDENRLSIVWRGSGPAIRPYHEEELKTMPYKVEWKNK
jgi:hypothetical protein